MTDSDPALDTIGRAAAELLPRLTERLARHGLGEIEVVDGDLRLRVRGTPSPASPSAAADPPTGTSTTSPPATAQTGGDEPAAPIPIGSPAVGFFVYADGLGPGLEVGKGDALGHVEMLGVRHEVRAPRGGTVRSLVAESGEAVEYGQTVVEIETAEPGR